jgi:nitroreductase
MDLYEAIQRRRCVRKFSASEISDEALLRIIDAGRLAPSGCNVADREYIIIRDRQTLALLHERVQPDFKNAAAAIALVMDPVGTAYGSYWVEDAAAAVQNMLLAIVAEGYDSVWIQGTLRPHEQWAKELLQIPENKRLYILLPIGRADNSGQRAPKPALEDVVYHEKYGR